MVLALFQGLGRAFGKPATGTWAPAQRSVQTHDAPMNKWERELNEARRVAGVIPSNKTKLTDDGYTYYEVIMSTHLVEFAKTLGVYLTVDLVVSIINTSGNDVAMVNEFLDIETRFTAAREQL